MTSTMRWADSDSDDSDDGYNVNEESSDASKAKDALILADNHQIQIVSDSPSFSKNKDLGNSSQRKHHHHEHRPKVSKRGGNSSKYSGGGKGKLQHHHNMNRGGKGPENWKELAKASSRFSSDNRDSSRNINGSAWMAQRKAKMEQEAREQKEKEAERLQQEQEEKQSRRKSQLSALKAAMCEIKQEQVEEGYRKKGPPTSGSVETPSPRVRILKKNAAAPTSRSDSDTEDIQAIAESRKVHNDPNNRKHKGENANIGSWRRSKASSVPLQTSSETTSDSTQPPPPPKYSYTIGQSPSNTTKQHQKSSHKAELQPDRSSVKFTRDRSAFTDDVKSLSNITLKDKSNAEANRQAEKEHIQASTNTKQQTNDNISDTKNGGSSGGNKGKKYQRVIVAFDDASGHPSTEKKKNKKKKLEKIAKNSDEADVASNLKPSCPDDNNDEEVASTKTSSSRGSSTMHSSSRSSRGCSGGRGRGNSQRRDSRSNKSGRGRGRGRSRGRGRGREGRGSQNPSSASLGNNSNESKGREKITESGKKGASPTTKKSNANDSDAHNGGGSLLGKEGKRRDSQSGKTANEGNRSDEKREPAGGRGRIKSSRGNEARGGRGHKPGRGARGGQRNGGKDPSKSSSTLSKKSQPPKYSYEIGKD